MIVLPALPLTDIGKPDKIPLRLDATRRAVARALADLGLTVDHERILCTPSDGRTAVTLPPLQDPGLGPRITARLALYGIDWPFP
ncbi:hypothetical protein ACH4TP_05835 [Streptomyces sp. NPDC021012]|uniref:hypothetical protein n=1 Tax=Streptomyces sp. NPDC021012 TaxID=3365107 RepID=UPI00378D9428